MLSHYIKYISFTINKKLPPAGKKPKKNLITILLLIYEHSKHKYILSDFRVSGIEISTPFMVSYLVN